jgi:hypothetical protein
MSKAALSESCRLRVAQSRAPAQVAGALKIALGSFRPFVQQGSGVALHRKYPADRQYRCRFGDPRLADALGLNPRSPALILQILYRINSRSI